MTKNEFETLKKKCPWFKRAGHEPLCIATQYGISPFQATLYCSRKNCAPLHWIELLEERKEKE